MQEILNKIERIIEEELPSCCNANYMKDGCVYKMKNVIAKAKEIILSEQKEPCEYILEDEDSNTWECSKCGELWQIISGTPQDNNMNYCVRCGREINQPYTEIEEVFDRR